VDRKGARREEALIKRWNRTGRILAAGLALSLGACAGQEKAVEQAALISDGRDIADAHCAACHAVGSFGESPVAAAPPFRRVLSEYNEATLQDDLIAGIQIAHPMPAFQINPKGVDALIAYLRTIQETPAAAR
jgi:mono/diheme cytochrome c family protein